MAEKYIPFLVECNNSFDGYWRSGTDSPHAHILSPKIARFCFAFRLNKNSDSPCCRTVAAGENKDSCKMSEFAVLKADFNVM